MSNAIQVGDRVKMSSRNYGVSFGTVESVFPANSGCNDNEPWAWVRWDHGGEGAPKLSDLQSVVAGGETHDT